MLLYLLLWPVLIHGVSMEPALNHGDRIFVSRALAFFTDFEQGNLVMLRAPQGDRRYIVKRIAALPGEEIMVGGEVFTVPHGHYFLLGDNSEYSLDSRNFGAVSESDIVARVLFRFFGGRFKVA